MRTAGVTVHRIMLRSNTIQTFAIDLSASLSHNGRYEQKVPTPSSVFEATRPGDSPAASAAAVGAGVPEFYPPAPTHSGSPELDCERRENAE